MKLRRYSEGTVIEVDAERDEIQDFVPLADCKKLVEANSHAHTNIQVWTKILQMLAEGKRIPQGRAAKSSAAASIVAPISELRRFYSSLKLLDKATWKNMSQFYCGNPKSLERLWNNARKTFSEYRNQDGWSQGKREALPTAQQRLSDVSSTNEFTAFMKQNGLGDKRAKYTFVERELNPWSTRLGMLSDKLPATKSGKGGIDLLLQSQTSGFPVVGEVKVKDDKNAFFALIQAMTYAVELSTPHQLARLRKHFDEFGQLEPNKSAVEIAIVMVNPVKDETLDSVLQLIAKLNRRKKCLGLARIRLLKNSGQEWTGYS